MTKVDQMLSRLEAADVKLSPCQQYGHLFDTMYPKSVYWCSQCESTHGTCAVGGAVSWPMASVGLTLVSR